MREYCLVSYCYINQTAPSPSRVAFNNNCPVSIFYIIVCIIIVDIVLFFIFDFFIVLSFSQLKDAGWTQTGLHLLIYCRPTQLTHLL